MPSKKRNRKNKKEEDKQQKEVKNVLAQQSSEEKESNINETPTQLHESKIQSNVDVKTKHKAETKGDDRINNEKAENLMHEPQKCTKSLVDKPGQSKKQGKDYRKEESSEGSHRETKQRKASHNIPSDKKCQNKKITVGAPQNHDGQKQSQSRNQKTSSKQPLENQTDSKNTSQSAGKTGKSKNKNGKKYDKNQQQSNHRQEQHNSPNQRNQQHSHKHGNRQMKVPEMKFEQYISKDECSEGLKRGELIKGSLRINPKAFKDAYIGNPCKGKRDIFIEGIEARNRALEGDIVAVKLLPKDQWKPSNFKDPVKSELNTESSVDNDENWISTGKVVYIIEKKHTRIVCGFIKQFCRNNLGFALMSPIDNRVPRLMIQLSECPPDFKENHENYAKTIFLARISDWNIKKAFAGGKLMRSLGEAGHIEPETEAILSCNDVDSSPFSQAVLKCLPNEKQWKVTEEELSKRKDFRNECIFTVDPASARDLDDALSCTKNGDDTFDVGVHIADVSHFIKEGSELDKEAIKRATSVYLSQRVIPMLPSVLCEKLCSLNPGVERLAYSVIWKLRSDGTILSEWFGRTVIRSCVKLSYDHAQKMIEQQDCFLEGKSFPEIFGNFKLTDITTRVKNLHTIAQKLRQRRFDLGALRLDQPKLTFTLDSKTGMPSGCLVYEYKDSNRMIEEYMLLANMAVGHRIYNAHPKRAILRQHAPPQEVMMQDVNNVCKRFNIPFNITDSTTISKSLNEISKIDDKKKRFVLPALTFLCAKPFQMAKYFCTGAMADETLYRHYALNVPIYTHFTSPIRRYPDVMVHRFLTAALDPSFEVCNSFEDLQIICDHCNDKKYKAKKASEQSLLLFFAVYLLEAGPLTEKAVVVAVLDKAVDVLCTRVGIVLRVYMDKLPLWDYKFSMDGTKPLLTLVWKDKTDSDLNSTFSIEEELAKLTFTDNVTGQIESNEIFAQGNNRNNDGDSMHSNNGNQSQQSENDEGIDNELKQGQQRNNSEIQQKEAECDRQTIQSNRMQDVGDKVDEPSQETVQTNKKNSRSQQRDITKPPADAKKQKLTMFTTLNVVLKVEKSEPTKILAFIDHPASENAPEMFNFNEGETDTVASLQTSEKVNSDISGSGDKSKKPRRHTTGGTKQTQEDIMIAQQIANSMENGKIINEYGQEIDPNSTLGRKQLVSMLKQRYGSDIENYRKTNDVGEKERMKRDRQKERDRRHEQRHRGNSSSEVDHRYINGVDTGNLATSNTVKTTAIKSTTTSSNGIVRRTSSGSAATSDGSDYSVEPSSPPMQTRKVKKTISAQQQQSSRYVSSDEEHEIRERAHTANAKLVGQVKEVVFLQYQDEMKRVNLPPVVSSLDVIKVLFINAFPGHITMPQFEDGSKTIYIKDMETGVYFQLEDVGDILNRSFLKIHEKEFERDSIRDYAESLQDFQLSSNQRMRRTNSGSSLRSESLTSRPTFMQELSSSPTSMTYTEGKNPITINGEKSSITVKTLESKPSAVSPTSYDELDDLTEMLKSALNDEEEMHAELMSMNHTEKIPGKIDPAVINSLQSKTEESARQTTLPKHYQPTVIIKAQQEAAKNEGTPVQRNLSYEKPPHMTIKTEAKKPSVKVTVRSKTSSTSSDRVRTISSSSDKDRSPDKLKSSSATSFKATPTDTQDGVASRVQINEDFFDPPNKQTYVECKVQKTTSSSAQKFDVSDLDDIVKNNPPSQHKMSMSPKNAGKKKAVMTVETKDTEDVEMELLEQLQNMEEEMKEYSFNLDQHQDRRQHSHEQTSSVPQQRQNSRKSSTSSMNSRNSSTTTPYASVKKSTSSASSIPDSPMTSRSNDVSRTSFSSHSDAAAEFEKLKSIRINDSTKVTSTSKAVRRTATEERYDVTDSVFTASSPSNKKEEFFRRTSSTGSTKSKPTRLICEKKGTVLTPDLADLEKSARRVRSSVEDLRNDLSNLRKAQLDNTRNFKNDIQKKLLEFRKKALRVDEMLQTKIDQNNNNIFANMHPVRESRHRLSVDQIAYGKKISSAEYKLLNLENGMEIVRVEVVGKKRVENLLQLKEFHEELMSLTKSISDIKNKYYGLQDTLQRVTKEEYEIIQTEESFIKEEPKKIESLTERCQTLSGTLETLQKLAQMQTEVQKQSRKKSDHDYQEVTDFSMTTTTTPRGVRFQR